METQRTLLEHEPHTTRSPGAWVLAAGACSLLLALLARDAAAQAPAPQEPAPSSSPLAEARRHVQRRLVGLQARRLRQARRDPRLRPDRLHGQLQPTHDTRSWRRRHEHAVPREGVARVARCRGAGRGPGPRARRGRRLLRSQQRDPPAPRLRPVRPPARRADLDDVHGRGQHPEHDRLRDAPGAAARPPGARALHLRPVEADPSRVRDRGERPKAPAPARSGGNDGEGAAGLHGPAPVHVRPGSRPAFGVRGPGSLSADYRRSDRRHDRGGDGLGPFPRLPPGLGLRPDLRGPRSGPIPRGA